MAEPDDAKKRVTPIDDVDLWIELTNRLQGAD